jgi:carbon-monoxide dehydrogenase medium subunit
VNSGLAVLDVACCFRQRRLWCYFPSVLLTDTEALFTFANTVKPGSFEYHRARDCDEVLSLLRDLGDDVKILAGGQSLIPMMNFRLSRPAHLVAITGIEELRYARVEGRELVVGAAARMADVEYDRVVLEQLPLLVEALRLVAHPPIRHRGTVCGSLAHADPAAELPAVALALGATLVVRNSDGERVLRADDFFQGALTTALAPDELLSEVRFPLGRGSGHAILECARTHGNLAVAGAVSVLRLDEEGRARDVAIVIFGACPRPTWVETATSLLEGEEPSEQLVAEAAELAAEEIETIEDVHGSAAFRRRLTGVYVRRSMARAIVRAREERE